MIILAAEHTILHCIRWEKEPTENPKKRQRNGSLSFLFNLYKNGQQLFNDTKHFLYADALVIAAQGSIFADLEQKLERALEDMSEHYQTNSVKPNPSKTQVSAFHL